MERQTAQEVIAQVLRGTMELLHPFMPFITEEIWQHLPHEGESIMLTNWPQANTELINQEIEQNMALTMDVIRAIRNLRSEVNVSPGKKADAVIITNSEKAYDILNNVQSYIKSLATVDTLTLGIQLERPEQAVTQVVQGVEIFLPLKGLIDMDKEIARLEKEIEKTESEIQRLDKKLNNQGFLAKAPQDVVEKERAKRAEYINNQEALQTRLESLKK